ncbi:MAG: N-acetylmuramoyl-L-alanine amidase [Alphaproteobacteria bacterium]|nr:N-acetylmuramoyl-L-alanine amidase [Alphaproteobacteria bacterium]MBM3655169.1 N-acetylmuramoyl-L-alanine amidase [Alphaproteobacteria bacterium]
MAFTVVDHILYNDGKPVSQKPTPNRGGVITPSLLVIHYTAGFTAQSAISTLINKSVQASAHLVIDRDGSVTQLAPFNIKTWHAGQSSWKGRKMCNGFSIGFEHVNCGPVLERGDGKLISEVAPSKVMPPSDCVRAHHQNGEKTPFWQIYPQAQVDASAEIAKAVCAAYGIKDIAGHYDIAPRRKRDPGPAWPMASYQSRVLGRK